MKTVAIVGGGIAGLATAYYLQTHDRANLRYLLLEQSDRLGGKVQTTYHDSFIVEHGPDSFLTQKPAALALCRALGLGESLIRTNQAQRKLYLVRAGRLVELPAGMNLIAPTQVMPVLRSPLLSPWGKLRLWLEPLIPARRDGDESMARFVRRRFGGEVLDRIAAPLLAGVYAGDPERLSMHATFGRFPETERTQGSLIRAARRQRQVHAPPPMWTPFVSLSGGMGQLVEALIARLDQNALRVNTTVVALQPLAPEGSGYRLTLGDGGQLTADAVILAVPAFVARDLVKGFDVELAGLLSQQRYISSATVALGYRRADVPHPLDGFGFVAPPGENRRITACTWSSTKFPGRAPEDHVLLRCFIGRDGQEDLLDLDDRRLVDVARSELAALLGVTGQPVTRQLTRWPRGMPQYDVGHLAWVQAVAQATARHAGLVLTGHPYRGIGLPDLIRDAQQVAAQVACAAQGEAAPRAPDEQAQPRQS